MTKNPLSQKISTPRRLGDSYELRLFALSCLKMLSDRSIKHVKHEDSSFAPADDVIIEYEDRIECFQAKHAMNPHALLEIDFTTAELVDKGADLHISLAKLGKAWHSLQGSRKTIIIRIFTNRAAGTELGLLLEGDRFKDEFVANTWQRRKRQQLQQKIHEEIQLSDDELISFLSCLRYDLRQPNEEDLDKVIRSDWLQKQFGLASSGVYDRFLVYAERWYKEKRTRPIYRDEILEALQIDNSTLPQRFPVDLKTYVARPDFEQEVLKVLFRDQSTYTAIVGTPGSGKSTFITRFTDELRRRGQPIIRYYAFAKVNDPFERERATAQAFLKSMIEQLCQEFRDLIPEERQYDYSESRFNELLTFLGSHFQIRGQQLLMVVDGIDHVGRSEIEKTQKLLNVLPVQLPAGVICLIGTQSTEYLPSVIEEQCREALVSIPLFEIQQTGYFLNRYFDTSSRPRQNTIDVIHKRSEGLPLYLYFIAERLKQGSVEEYNELVENLPPYEGDINSYYIALWSEFIAILNEL